jgi:hypothetical protein
MTKRAALALIVLSASFGSFWLDASLGRARATVTSAAPVTIWGKIQAEDIAAFKRSVANGPITMVNLNSTRGDPYAAMAIGRIIRERQLHVLVSHPGKCSGICVLLYISGAYRSNYGTIELYRPELADMALTAEQLSTAVPKLRSAIRAYIAEMGVSDEFANAMLNTDKKAPRTFNGETDIRPLVPEYDVAYKDTMDAITAREFGLTIAEYRKREEASVSCRTSSPLGHYDDCQGAIMWGLSVSNFELRHKRADTVCATERQDLSDLSVTGVILTEGFWNDPIVLRYRSCTRKVMQGN